MVSDGNPKTKYIVHNKSFELQKFLNCFKFISPWWRVPWQQQYILQTTIKKRNSEREGGGHSLTENNLNSMVSAVHADLVTSPPNITQQRQRVISRVSNSYLY